MSQGRSNEERFPELFNQTNINRRTCKRVVPMQVLIIGLLRSGTKSMRAALKRIGYSDVYHMDSCMENPPDNDMWQQAIDAKYYGKGMPFGREEWDQLLGHCEACIDCPTANFMPELIAAYPKAKVIVCMRDPEAWYQSLSSTINYISHSYFLTALSFVEPFFLGRWIPFVHALGIGMFDGKMYTDAGFTKSRYIQMHEEVRQIVPKDQLLEYKLGDGWKPICDFLCKDVPDVPFPRVNEAVEFRDRIGVMKKEGIKRVARNTLPYLGAVAGLGLIYRYLRT